MRKVVLVAAVAAAAAIGLWALNGPFRTVALAAWADYALGESEPARGDALLGRRLERREAINAALGEAPAARPGALILVNQEERAGQHGYALSHVRFTLPDGDVGVALVAYPARTPLGIAIATHQTTDVGMQEVMGLAGSPDLAYGDALAQAGFMVIAPDTFTTGERVDAAQRWSTAAFYEVHPNWSAMGKMLSDHRAALSVGLDLYTQRYGAEPNCVAAVGHSLGAHNALFLAAFDERVDVVVANGGFERIATDDDAVRWARDGGFIYMPALTQATRGQAPLTWDWEDVLMQIYPRSVLLIQGLSDPIFTHEISVAQAARAAESAYQAGGQGDRFDAALWSGPHAFPASMQQQAVEWTTRQCQTAQQR